MMVQPSMLLPHYKTPGSVDVLSEGLRFSVCSSRLIYCLVPQEQERIVLVWEL